MTAKSTLNVVRATPEHYEQIILRAMDKSRAEVSHIPMIERFMGYLALGPAVTLLTDRGAGWEVVAIGGVTKAEGEAIGTCWMLTSDLVPLYAKTVLRMCRNMVAMAHNVHKMRRVQALVLVGYDAAHRFAQACGLEYEGVLRAFDPDGRDQAMYSSIRKQA